MNYRHRYHAGNFADVAKHVVLLALVEGMQRKTSGWLYLDTHAGCGAYDLATADRGDSLARAPEWPDGVGRLETVATPPRLVANYLEALQDFATQHAGDAQHPYPGSPSLVAERLRTQDRAMLCELQPDECAALDAAMAGRRRVRVECRDGYEAVRGCLPPLERRALVLIDPPYEQADEAERVLAALREGLRRAPAATFAVWYPITARVGLPAFMNERALAGLPPTWTAELTVAGPQVGLKMPGAGVMVVNPPWEADREIAPTMTWLGRELAQGEGGGGTLRWLVRE